MPVNLEKQAMVPMIYRRHGDTTPKFRNHTLGNSKPATYYMRELASRGETGSSTLLSPSSLSTIRPFNPKFVENDKKVLRYDAYFLESVHESTVETYRVRHCQVLYYLEDDTVQLTEPKVENSGMLQGNFVKRHRIPMPISDEQGNVQFFTYRDLNIGHDVTFYGRVFHIFAMDGFTREYLSCQGITVPVNESVPSDPYTVQRRAQKSGQDPAMASNHGKKKYPMKDFMEASLGKFSRPDDQLRQFLAHDRHVLRFFAIWDDRTKLHGLCHRYTLHYFLADQTIEILESYARNSGCDPFPKLLNRAKLCKDPVQQTCSTVGDEMNACTYVSWHDLAIGTHLQVYNRRLYLLDADVFTRSWYTEHQLPLAPALEFPEAQTPPSVRLLAPKEECCPFLTSQTVRQGTEWLDTSEMLRFRARFETKQPEDVGRRFIVSVTVADQSVAISEPVERNSGVIGGKFLEKRRIRRTGTDKSNAWLDLTDFYLGARVQMAGQTFVLYEMDEYSAKYMDARPETFPRSDKVAVLRKMYEEKVQTAVRGCRKEQQLDENELRALLCDVVPDFTQHEAFTLIRHYGDKDSKTISIEALLEK